LLFLLLKNILENNGNARTICRLSGWFGGEGQRAAGVTCGERGGIVRADAVRAGWGVYGRVLKSDMKILNRALSVRQPYAEQIMRGIKRIEYRSMPTKLRGRVYIYASKTPGYLSGFEKIKAKPGDFPVGVVIGTVEIVDCTGEPYEYEWHLAKPKRLKKPMEPNGHPQPVWFEPFKEKIKRDIA
jgi:hypothetical protein